MRGRKVGSVSFQLVTLEELNRLLKPDATVVVSNRFAKLLGLKGKPVAADMGMYNEVVASNTSQHALETFGADVEQTLVIEEEQEETVKIKPTLQLTEFNK